MMVKLDPAESLLLRGGDKLAIPKESGCGIMVES